MVKVPSMGDSITEGSVFEMTKSKLNIQEEGQFAELDEIIAVIETDKVKVDIRSPERGIITKFYA
jgi:pyruvate/2-oxoglutarate dehydrogenase complex dihydrolipoamide acyltransferase (E2) component